MKTNKLLLFFMLLTSIAGFCTTITITAVSDGSKFEFSPDEVVIASSDVVNFQLASIHNAIEVSKETWDADGSTPLSGGFVVPFGGGTLTGLSVGTHYYVCENHVAMGMKGRIIVSSLGVNENYLVKNFSIYPNPSTDFVTVKANDNFSDLTYSILDIQGRQISKGELENVTTSIDLSELNPGVYFLQVGEVKRQTLKLIKK